MNEERDNQVLPMAVAHGVLISALIKTHPDLVGLEAAVVRSVGIAEHSMGNTDRDELADESLREAIAANVRHYLEVIRLAAADRSSQ